MFDHNPNRTTADINSRALNLSKELYLEYEKRVKIIKQLHIIIICNNEKENLIEKTDVSFCRFWIALQICSNLLITRELIINNWKTLRKNEIKRTICFSSHSHSPLPAIAKRIAIKMFEYKPIYWINYHNLMKEMKVKSNFHMCVHVKKIIKS